MKSGAGDDPFAEDSDADDASVEQAEERTDSPPETREQASQVETSGKNSPQGQALPYKYRRDSVKDGRNQQPVFLQSTTETLIEETIDNIEGRFDEDIYKTDVVEAMLVAGAEGTTPEAVLQRWGYGMKNR